MIPLTIDVSGTSTVSRQPNFAIVKLHVEAQGDSPEIAENQVTATSKKIDKLFSRLSRDAPDMISSFSPTNFYTWCNSPYRHILSRMRRLVFNASTSYEVCFWDFDLTRVVVEYVALLPHVKIQSVDWKLTEESEEGLATWARTRAMLDAMKKATDLAEVIGRKVVPTHIRDAGSKRFYPPSQVPGMSRQMRQSNQSYRLHSENNHRDDIRLYELEKTRPRYITLGLLMSRLRKLMIGTITRIIDHDSSDDDNEI
ncbi:hypothetical protein N7488_006030 [Penicillium malachiteum]|nr:hypothetical protein N7488_006030 [Penicillium malachiteum]